MWESLRNILTAYAAHDPVMGYVQSMNFIAAFLLLAGLAEEDAFWCLVALVDRVVPGYFSEVSPLISALRGSSLPGCGFETGRPPRLKAALVSKLDPVNL